MKNFRRALADAMVYWPWLVCAWLCSACVAALWSANIAAAFPILEVTLRGEAPQQWNARRLEEAKARVVGLTNEIDALHKQLPAVEGVAQHQLQQKLNELELNLTAERSVIESITRLRPWLERYVPHDPFHVILAVCGMLVCSVVLKQVLHVASSMLTSYVSNRIARNLRHQVFDKALEMDRAGFLSIGQSGFTAQITHTCEGLAAGINSVFGGAVSEPLRLIACLIGAALISWKLLLASMLFAPLSAIAIMWLNRRLKALARQLLERSVGFHHVLLEALHSMMTVQAYTMENQERKRFHQATGDMMRFSLNAHFYNTLAGPVTEALGIGMICLAITLGAHLTLHQTQSLFGIRIFDQPLSVSAMMVFFGMLVGASDPVRKLSGIIAGINSGMVAADMLYPLLDRKSLVQDPKTPANIRSPHRELTLQNVTFGYHAESPVLREVNLTIPFGETVAIIGPNGCGKSTLVGLLCRFYDPQGGRVLLDGVSLSELLLKDVRGRMALVTQHTELFNESIYHNIRYGKWDATEEEIVAASKLARAHEFIQHLPEGYQTMTGPSGLKLSGGQRQRIVLARALLRNPEILILDEATSQIDVDSERLIHDVLASFGRSCTIIIITHRESALALADRVIRIDHGQATVVKERARLAA